MYKGPNVFASSPTVIIIFGLLVLLSQLFSKWVIA
jgi:hypothetical protein